MHDRHAEPSRRSAGGRAEADASRTMATGPAAGRRWTRSLLHWTATGATVIALGTGTALLSGAAPTSAQTGPPPQPSPVVPPPPPPGQPPSGLPGQGGPGLFGNLMPGPSDAVLTPGTVTAVSDTSLTVQSADQQRGLVTFSVTPDTMIMVGPGGPGFMAPPGGPGAPPNPPAPGVGMGPPPGQAGGGTMPPMPGQGQGPPPDQGQPLLPPPLGSIADLHPGDQIVVVADQTNPTVARAILAAPHP